MSYYTDPMRSGWIIEEVLGFDIQNLEKNKKLENNFCVDLYGEDKFGNAIVLYGDSEVTSDETLRHLLCNAAASNVEKLIWIAPSVRNYREGIVNWLNGNHYSYMRFYLIKAERIVKPNNKTDATMFQLLTGPDTSWRE